MKITDEELKIAKRVAKKMAARWERIDWEDLNSHLVLWLCENQRHLERWRNEEGGMGKLSVSLTREASDYVNKEQSELNGGKLYYDIKYKPEQIKAIIPFIWEYSTMSLQRGVPEHPQFGTPIFDTSPINGNIFDDALAILADVSSAYYDLSVSDKKIISMRFKEDMSYKDIADFLQIKVDAARKRVDRAVEHISEKLTSGIDIDSKYKRREKENND